MIDSGAAISLAKSSLPLNSAEVAENTIITTAGSEQLTKPKRGCLPFTGADGTRMGVMALQHPKISTNLLSLSQLFKNHPGSKAAYDEKKFTFLNKEGTPLLKGWQEGGQWFINLNQRENEHANTSGRSVIAAAAREENSKENLNPPSHPNKIRP